MFVYYGYIKFSNSKFLGAIGFKIIIIIIIIIIWGMGTIVGVASWLSARSMLMLLSSV